MLRQEDLIDRAIDRLRHIEPTIDAERLAALESVLRQEYGGQYSRPAKRSSKEREALHQAIRDAYCGQPLRELARVIGVHHSTVHRVLGSLKDRP
jgi:hypothetical protein